MFKHSHITEKRRVPPPPPKVANGSRKWLWIVLGVLSSSTALGVVLAKLLTRNASKRKHSQGGMLVEPPYHSIEGEEGEASPHKLHVSHSAPSLLTQPAKALWDVVVVGGGPAGATVAYYLAKQQINVLILEKDSFPRDKICGDQIQPLSQHILSDMGVLQSLLDDDVVKWTTNRGIVSPSGYSFIGELKDKETLISVQRIVLDKKLMEAATKAGASLKENVCVKSAHLHRDTRKVGRFGHAHHRHRHNPEGENAEDESETIEGDHWMIHVVSSDGHRVIESPIYARLLVCADGANSNIARNLTGLAPDESPSPFLGPPNAAGCRAFAKHRTHHCRADEVSFYTRDLLPGSFRISSELEDYLNLSCFVLPSDDYNTSQLPLHALQQFNHAIREPWINATLGPACQLTPVKSAPMRVGGIHRTYFPHGLIVGDAAGQTDPLSGDGLPYGMRAAQMAASTLARALAEGKFGSPSMQRYEQAWRQAFGWDFFWGRQIVYLMARFPILVDAVSLVIQRQGMKAIAFWALAKAGSKSKWELILWFLRPDVAWLMVFYVINLWLKRKGFF